jgi:hypothetical protein
MKFVVLIGTNHKYQLPGTPAETEFRNFVEHICEIFAVRAIAEEMSLEALVQKHTSQSLCEQIANDKGIVHQHCDPSNHQRKALNIRQEQDIRMDAFFRDWDHDQLEREIRASHAIREDFWLNQLLNLDCWPTLFICGADHIKHFCKTLEANHLRAEVVALDWPNSCP